VILGRSEILLLGLPEDAAARKHLEQIQSAARRSSALARQLLAFARQQPVSPRILRLDDTVGSMLSMLRQLIGEDVRLSWASEPDLGAVRVDPVHLDQILANLCVNARDAIEGTGQITIRATNRTAREGEGPPGMPAGRYVVLSVEDSGQGMDEHVLAHAFEPFFTTKGTARGTGLGLSTVYGIVQQNGAFIDISSTVGRGTTLRIWIPRVADEAVEAGGPSEDALPFGRGETVLVVEDEPAVLGVARTMLETLGYRVIEARSPSDALRLAATPGCTFDLVLSDVIMPEMNGCEIVRRLQAARPGLRCVLMSAYAADVLARRGLGDDGIRFLSKPFDLGDLARSVREVLDAPHSVATGPSPVHPP
jgi:CheY-like chemotaxis protein